MSNLFSVYTITKHYRVRVTVNYGQYGCLRYGHKKYLFVYLFIKDIKTNTFLPRTEFDRVHLEFKLLYRDRPRILTVLLYIYPEKAIVYYGIQ